MSEPTATPAEPRTGRARRLIGYALLVISTATWCTGVFAAPWLPGSVARRATAAGVLIVIGEATFWGAIPFLGKEIVLAFRRYLNPVWWYRRWRAPRPPAPPPAAPLAPSTASRSAASRPTTD